MIIYLCEIKLLKVRILTNNMKNKKLKHFKHHLTRYIMFNQVYITPYGLDILYNFRPIMLSVFN